MKAFARLYERIDRTRRTAEKVAALRDYFGAAPPEDATWALGVLLGRRERRAVTGRTMRTWVAEEAGLPSWVVDASYAAVGDLAETLALLLPRPRAPRELALGEVMSERVAPLGGLAPDAQRELLRRTWHELDGVQRFLYHKLIMGNFRVGVARTLVTRAVAEALDVEPAVMAHRLMGGWTPTPERFEALASPPDDEARAARPYPFFLASPLEAPTAELGAIDDWMIEWKWDGLRAQLVRRDGETLVWSRGDEPIAPAFPELVEIGRGLSDGTVLDGEILAWEADRPLPFTLLQRRIGRTRGEPMLFADVPIVFMAFDVPEADGRDLRGAPLDARRARLAELVRARGAEALRLSPRLDAASWADAARWQAAARAHGTEGVMLKRRDSTYGVGRRRGAWWKWKVDPFTIDAVLTTAQPGSGRRASLYTDYTFAVWDGGALVPVARAYSGLTDEEIRAVDRHVRRTTIERRGAVRIVEPQLVFELAFEGVQSSTRHRSGVALRFPRMTRWRRDKAPGDADRLDALRALLPEEAPW